MHAPWKTSGPPILSEINGETCAEATLMVSMQRRPAAGFDQVLLPTMEAIA